MFKVFKNLIPYFSTLFFICAYYYDFFADSLYLLNILCVFGSLVSIFCTFLPTKRALTTLPFTFMPFLVVFAFTYNFVFSSMALVLSVILWVFVPKKRTYTKISFDEDCTPLYTRKTVKKPFSETLAWGRNVFLSLISLVVIFSFVFTTPQALWLVRAFPVDFSQKETFEGEVIPLGHVTSTAWYDENALLIDSFYNIDDSILSPGLNAGLKEGDIVIKINGERALKSDFIQNGADENPAVLTVKRATKTNYETLEITVTPVYSQNEGRYLIGIKYYSTASMSASVQTLSFAYPKTGYFAGTAHSSEGVYDDINTLRGILFSSRADGRDEDGLVAVPEEIWGMSHYTDNYGCYGVLDTVSGETMPIARKHHFKLGKATLLSTIEGRTPKEYSVHIMGTYRVDNRDVMYLVVTDPALMEKGGITKGMSGSPIIQEGKIIGALSNMDKGGSVAYATFSYDMAHMLYKNSDKLSTED